MLAGEGLKVMSGVAATVIAAAGGLDATGVAMVEAPHPVRSVKIVQPYKRDFK
jgi:hypothetical protein